MKRGEGESRVLRLRSGTPDKIGFLFLVSKGAGQLEAAGSGIVRREMRRKKIKMLQLKLLPHNHIFQLNLDFFHSFKKDLQYIR